MSRFPRILHFLGLSAFVGTVLMHGLILIVADPARPDAYAALMALKDTSTKAVLIPGMALLGMSGMALARRLPRPLPSWLRAKLVLIPLMAANGLLVLLPAGHVMARLSAQGLDIPPALLLREEIAGTANLLLVLAVIALSALRRLPGRGKAVAKAGGAEG